MEGVKSTRPESHLKEGIKPIVACLGTPLDFDHDDKSYISQIYSEQMDGVHNVNYYEDSSRLQSKGFLNGGYRTYVISTIDESRKFSTNYCDCTGLIVAGVDKETGRNISFLTHQDPRQIFLPHSKFENDLKKRLEEMKNRCVSGTVDAVVIGGNYINNDNIFLENYKKSVEVLSGKTKEILNFKPIIINGPKVEPGGDGVYYDNDTRQMYFIRPKVNEKTGSFSQDNLGNELGL